jgi:hypothetical protein
VNRAAVKALDSLAQHRSVVLLQETLCDVDYSSRIDAEQVAGVGQMVDRAEGEPVIDRGDALRRRVRHDVGGLH